MATRHSARKPLPIQKPTIIRTFSLTGDDEVVLTRLAQEVADRVGRSASKSQVMRALLRLTREFNEEMLNRLVGSIEAELDAGVRWGRDAVKR